MKAARARRRSLEVKRGESGPALERPWGRRFLEKKRMLTGSGVWDG